MLRGLLEPMLARPAEIPTGSDWRFEFKWDGFRGLVSTLDDLFVRSRHGWNMARQLPELGELPTGLVLDGELVVWGEDGLPSFPLLQRRILHDQREIPVMFLAFDVLAVDGESTMCLPCAARRRLLEGLELSGPAWHTPCAFEDGQALFATVCERGLEGIVGASASPSPTGPVSAAG